MLFRIGEGQKVRKCGGYHSAHDTEGV
jgi:hypothetical protein